MGSKAGEAPLADDRREAFARAFAGGASRTAAYARAGYLGGRSAASRLARRPEVAARVAALRRRAERMDEAEPEAAIVVLMEAAACADLTCAAGLREAREALLEARQLQGELVEERLRAG
jgi:hypothetical protein